MSLPFWRLLLYKVPWLRQLIAGIGGYKPQPPAPVRCNCDSCDTTSGYTCSYTGVDQIINDAYIANAYSGNLLLTPGDASGIIGGLLHALNPPQHYSHMGVIVADHNLVRHCTASAEWLTDKAFFSGSVLGTAAPVDGLNTQHLEYAWPGTITQSIYQAVIAYRYGNKNPPPGSTTAYTGANLTYTDPSGATAPTGPYLMADLSFDPVSDDGQTWYYPLIVKPCPLLQTADVTKAMSRIAQSALGLYAHYRFYCYTNGAIGALTEYLAPGAQVPVAQPDFNTATGQWNDWAQNPNWTAPASTIPAVCSSFAWQAIKNAYPKNFDTSVVLDWAKSQTDALGQAGGACVRSVAPIWSGDTLDPYTQDGLYFYDAAERKIAGQTLHDNLSLNVYTQLKKSLSDNGGISKTVAGALDDLGRGAFIAAAEAGVAAVTALLLTMLPAVVLDVVFIEELINLLYDMPEHIANQVCTAFAFDCYNGFPGDTSCVDADGNPIKDANSSNWSSSPGDGRAVSPDNIHMFWDAPGPTLGKTLQGLYGYNEPAQLCLGTFSRPICELLATTGVATISGQVVYNGRALVGAYVTVGCQTVVTTTNQPFHISVKSGGRYKLVARATDPDSGTLLYGEAVTGSQSDPPVQPDADVWVDIKMIPPPSCMRNVVVQGIIRCDDVYLTGSDNNQQSFFKTLYLQSGVPVFNIASGTWIIEPSPLTRMSDNISASFAVGDSNGLFTMSATIDPSNNSVSVTVQGWLNQGTDDDNMSTPQETFVVPADQTVTVPDSELDTGGPFNDRAYFRGITIANLAAPI
jgi:hypothetical protein